MQAKLDQKIIDSMHMIFNIVDTTFSKVCRPWILHLPIHMVDPCKVIMLIPQ
jgi:hypothetical protein